VAGRWLALLASVATLRCRCRCGVRSTPHRGVQFPEKLPWIPRFDAWYALGVDGISLP